MTPGEITADAIGDLYEAALDDKRFADIAGIVAKATGMPTAGVWFIDRGQVLDMALTDDIRATQQPYLAHYSKLDVWQQGLLRGPWNCPRVGYELFSERDLAKTEFYNDFARTAGMFRPMGAVIQIARDSFATVATNRPGGSRLVEESDKPRLARVLPHMRRALQLRLTQRRHAGQGRLLAATLDALAFGVVVCDRAGLILRSNRAAETLARAGAGIVLGDRKKGIGAVVASEAKLLMDLVHDAATGGPGGAVRLTGKTGVAELSVLVTPLPRAVASVANEREGCALITMRSTLDSPAFSAEIVGALFGLSRAQAEIALAIFDGKAPEVIAAERGVTISTLRTHLAGIFARTGVDNQRGLVRLLGTLPPVRNGARLG